MTVSAALGPGILPRREALDLVLDVWVHQRTGALWTSGGQAEVVLGEPVDEEALQWLGRALASSELRFREGEAVQVGGARAPLGPTLLEAGRRLGSPGQVRATLDAVLVAGPYAAALARLPLRAATRRLVRDALGSAAPLGDTLRNLGLSPEAVEQDLAALVALGLVRTRGAAPPRLRPGGGGEAAAPDDLRHRHVLGQRRLGTRLEREWRTMAGTDDWGVLGISPGADPVSMQRGAARMRARYAALSSEVDDPDTRRMLGALRERVESAIDRLRVPETSSSSGEELLPGPEQALRLGQAAAARGDLPQARRWLGLAHRQDPDEPLTRAWYGWALVIDPRTATGGAVERGHALVAQALALAPSDPAVLERALEVAIHLARADEARGLLARLMAAAPGHPSLASLDRRVARL